MPVNHEKKYIHVHIPKTAGSSINLWLSTPRKIENFHAERNNNLLVRYNKTTYTIHHFPAFLLEKFCQPYFDYYYKFAFVRNPYDRAVSKFFWDNKANPAILEADLNTSLELFKRYLDELSLRVNDDSVFKKDHDCLQSVFVFGKRQKLLVDDLFKLEEIDSAINKLKSKLCVQEDIPFVNKRRVRQDIDKNLLLTDETRSKIYSIYKTDFQNFGYNE